VPSLRGREADRRPGDILAEIEMLVADGVSEVTLLGQNVNAYGVQFGDRQAFSKLLRACGTIDGLDRVRFTSPHPANFTDDVIAAMAETGNVCHQLHMPLQSGSDRILKAMRRSYRSEKYLRILGDVRSAMPDAAITTDIIVGFPGETEEDFKATIDVVRASRFSSAYTFQYSPRPGTPTATMDDQVPPEVVSERYQRLVEVVDECALASNREQVGAVVEVLVASGEGRKDGATHRLSGRARDGRLVHFTPTGAAVQGSVRAGDYVTTVVSYGAPHYLIADGDLVMHRRTRAGDRAERGFALRTPGVGTAAPVRRSRRSAAACAGRRRTPPRPGRRRPGPARRPATRPRVAADRRVARRAGRTRCRRPRARTRRRTPARARARRSRPARPSPPCRRRRTRPGRRR
jgi:tRNA-2-methylthio-N6-dimethylallyladenosine synthase